MRVEYHGGGRSLQPACLVSACGGFQVHEALTTPLPPNVEPVVPIGQPYGTR